MGCSSAHEPQDNATDIALQDRQTLRALLPRISEGALDQH